MLRRAILTLLPLAICLPSAAGDKIVTIGDSLTFAYEAEFGLPIIADGYGTRSKNWIEILNGNTSGQGLRPDFFDIGERRALPVNLFGPLLFRHEFNWSLPGAKVAQLRRFLDGSGTLSNLMGASGSEGPDFSVILSMLGLTDEVFHLEELKEQVKTKAKRFVYFVGGNDVRDHYAEIYSGADDGQGFLSDYLAEAQASLDLLTSWNSHLPGVVVAVPHIGITPDIRKRYPYDVEKTGRVTKVLSKLNKELHQLATSKGLGFADIYTPTLRNVDPANPLVLYGFPFANEGADPPDARKVWLAGKLSANFHPHTNANALIANSIIEAFNERYQSGIPRLTATEILKDLLGFPEEEIDMDFAAWMKAYGLAGKPESDDSDGDGLPAAVEFALGLNPTYNDAHLVRQREIPEGIDVSYPLRLPGTSKVKLELLHKGKAEAANDTSPKIDSKDGRVHILLEKPASGPPAAKLELKATLPKADS